MARTRLASSTARGYNSHHQALRTRLLEVLARNPGQPCRQDFPDGTICGKPTYAWQDLHLGHTRDKQGYLGLVHAACNIGAAQLWKQARLGRRAYKQQTAASRKW